VRGRWPLDPLDALPGSGSILLQIHHDRVCEPYGIFSSEVRKVSNSERIARRNRPRLPKEMPVGFVNSVVADLQGILLERRGRVKRDAVARSTPVAAALSSLTG